MATSDRRCPECGSPLVTNGRAYWCSFVECGYREPAPILAALDDAVSRAMGRGDSRPPGLDSEPVRRIVHPSSDPDIRARAMARGADPDRLPAVFED